MDNKYTEFKAYNDLMNGKMKLTEAVNTHGAFTKIKSLIDNIDATLLDNDRLCEKFETIISMIDARLRGHKAESGSHHGKYNDIHQIEKELNYKENEGDLKFIRIKALLALDQAEGKQKSLETVRSAL